jgi:putative FmdB family regulatory protein
MPLYDYRCARCGLRFELNVRIDDRDIQICRHCATPLTRELAAPMGKIAGQVAKGGGADRFVAEQLGIPVKELPAPLRTPQDQCNG